MHFVGLKKNKPQKNLDFNLYIMQSLKILNMLILKAISTPFTAIFIYAKNP